MLHQDWKRRLAQILFWSFWDIGFIVLLWWYLPIKYFVLILGIFSGLVSVTKRAKRKWEGD
jgi:hypothetical protein